MSLDLSQRIPSPTVLDLFDPNSQVPSSPIDSPEPQKSVAVLFKTQTDHNNAFDMALASNKLYMDMLIGDGEVGDLEIRTPDGNLQQALGRVKQRRMDAKLCSLTIWAHGEPTQTHLGRNLNTGLYKIEDVAAEHFSALQPEAPVYMVSCSTAPIGKKIAEVSHHPVYAPTKVSYSGRTFLVPNEDGELELLQWGAQGERITKLYRYEDEVLVESEPRAYRQAFNFLSQKAEAGNVAAQYAMGEFHEFGRETQLDLNRAASWYARAAKQGHEMSLHKLKTLAKKGCGTAAMELATMYSEGTGVKKDEKEAQKWLKRAQQSSCCVLL